MITMETAYFVGKTSAQLAALPSGALFLVHSRQLADYCRGLLRKSGRPINDIRFVTPESIHCLQGLDRDLEVDVDHAFHHLAPSRYRWEARDVLRATFPKFRQ